MIGCLNVSQPRWYQTTVDGSFGNRALSGVVVGTMPDHVAQESLELAHGRSRKGLERPAGKAQKCVESSASSLAVSSEDENTDNNTE